MKRITAILVVAGTLTSSGTPCFAQESSRKLRWNANEQPEGRVSNQSFIRMSSSVNGEKYEVEINGEEIRATVNDEPVSAERIRRSEGGVDILDEAGNLLHRFNIFTQSGNARSSNDRRRGVVEQEQKRPKVMIGITMDESPEGIRVDSVIEGLPAAAAGLKVGDVIRELNDRPIDDPSQFREALGSMEVGEVARIIVFRDGKDIELKVKTERFDEERLGREAQGRAMTLKPEAPTQRAHKEFMNELRDSLKGLDLSEEQRKLLEERLGSTFSRLTESMNLGLMGNPDGMALSGPNRRVWTFDDSMPDGMSFMIPRGDRFDDRRFDELMRRFEAMEKRIETLSRRLERKQAEPEH